MQGHNLINMSPSVLYNKDKLYIQSGIEFNRRKSFFIESYYKFENTDEKSNKVPQSSSYFGFFNSQLNWLTSHSILGVKYSQEFHQYFDKQSN